MGSELGVEFYDEVYSNERRYTEDYTNLPYYPIFQVALGMIRDVENPKILELGCGTGQFAKMLWDNDIRDYLGIDFSEKAVEIARKFSPQKFEVADIRAWNIREEFNVVVMLEVLEHLSDDLSVLRGINQGTTVIFSVPRFDDPGHVRLFKRKEDVEDRYRGLIDIEEIIKYASWFIVKGEMNGTYDSSVIRQETA